MQFSLKWILAGLAAVGLVSIASLTIKTDDIETDLTDRTSAMLSQTGHDWAKVEFSGRDAVISGVPPDSGSQAKVIADTDAIWGVRQVTDATTLLAEQSPFTWSIRRDGPKVEMSGYVPPRGAKRLHMAIADRIPGATLVGETSDARGAPAAFDKLADLAIGVAGRLEQGAVTLSDNRLDISGDAGSPDIKDAILQMVKTADLGNVMITVDGLTAPQPPQSDPSQSTDPATATDGAATDGAAADGSGGAQTVAAGSGTPAGGEATPQQGPFQIQRGPDGVILTGSVPNDAVKSELEKLARRKFGWDMVASNLVVGGADFADGFEKAAHSALQAVSRVRQGTARISGTQVTFEGNALRDKAQDAIDRLWKNKLPQNFQTRSKVSIVPIGAVVSGTECQKMLNASLASNRILFESGKADISTDSFGLLDFLIYSLLRCPKIDVRIEGHTDSDGDDALNQQLSEARASSVVKYLAANGLKADRMTSVGHGESKPIASNDTEDGKARNRRIEFVLKTEQ